MRRKLWLWSQKPLVSRCKISQIHHPLAFSVELSFESLFVFNFFIKYRDFFPTLFKFRYQVFNFVSCQVRLTLCRSCTWRKTDITTYRAVFMHCLFLAAQIRVIVVNFIPVNKVSLTIIRGILKIKLFRTMLLCGRLMFQRSISRFSCRFARALLLFFELTGSKIVGQAVTD